MKIMFLSEKRIIWTATTKRSISRERWRTGSGDYLRYAGPCTAEADRRRRCIYGVRPLKGREGKVWADRGNSAVKLR